MGRFCTITWLTFARLQVVSGRGEIEMQWKWIEFYWYCHHCFSCVLLRGGVFLFYVLVHLSMYSWSIRFSNEIYMYLACIFQNYPESNFFFYKSWNTYPQLSLNYKFSWYYYRNKYYLITNVNWWWETAFNW